MRPSQGLTDATEVHNVRTLVSRVEGSNGEGKHLLEVFVGNLQFSLDLRQPQGHNKGDAHAYLYAYTLTYHTHVQLHHMNFHTQIYPNRRNLVRQRLMRHGSLGLRLRLLGITRLGGGRCMSKGCGEWDGGWVKAIASVGMR